MNNADNHGLDLDSAELDEQQLENARGGVYVRAYGIDVPQYSLAHTQTVLRPNPSYSERLNFNFAVQHGFPITLRVY